LSDGKPRPSVIGDAEGVLELLWLVLTAVGAWLRPRQDLVAENLLLHHRLAVLTRPIRTRPTSSAGPRPVGSGESNPYDLARGKSSGTCRPRSIASCRIRTMSIVTSSTMR